MNDDYLNKRNNNFVVALLLLFPIVVTTVKGIGNLILLILVFFGLYLLTKEKKSPFRIPELKVVSWLTLSYFLIMLLSILVNEDAVNNLYHLGRKAHFIFAPLIALAIYRADIKLEDLLASIKFGLVITFIIVLYKNYNYTGVDTRVFNGNIFGDLVLTLTFFSIVNFFKESNLHKLISIFSFASGMYVVISSGNRGTLLVSIFLGLVYLVLIIQKYFKGKRIKQFITILAFVISIYMLLSIPTIEHEVQSAISNVTLWFSGVTVNSSAGLRLEMWYGSIEAFKSSPLIGHGYRNANSVVSTFVDPAFREAIFNYSHLHNEYITNLISAGVLGLLSLLALLFIPFVIFIKCMKDDETYIYCTMGILLCVSYAGIGLTHIAFGEENVNSLFIYFITFLLPKVQGMMRFKT